MPNCAHAAAILLAKRSLDDSGQVICQICWGEIALIEQVRALCPSTIPAKERCRNNYIIVCTDCHGWASEFPANNPPEKDRKARRKLLWEPFQGERKKTVERLHERGRVA